MPDSTAGSAEGKSGRRDWLLSAVWWLLTALMLLCLVVGAFGLLAFLLILANMAGLAGGLHEMRMPESALPWLGLLGILVAVTLALIYFFLRHLRRMVDSVAENHPFDRVNADRLRQMAWLSVAIQIAGVPLTKLIIWFDAMPYKPNVHHDSDGISFGGIVLTLILFVLARVFRTGAEMQEDLEGTV